MSQNSAIGWTDATWNPVTGCSHVSDGCRFCYAEDIELRFGRSLKPWTAQNADENVQLHPERLAQPLSWRTPKRVFVNSMSDMFHELVPDEFLDQCFAVMALASRHTFQILTKRPERMAGYRLTPKRWDAAREWLRSLLPKKSMGAWEYVGVIMANQQWPLPNVWLGVSCENQRAADERIPLLLETPAAVRFISAEPLLGPLDLSEFFYNPPTWEQRPAWVIIGGESGPHARAAEVGWIEHLASQCVAAGCAVFVKQDSGPRPGKQGRLSDALWARKEYPVGVRAVESPQDHTP